MANPLQAIKDINMQHLHFESYEPKLPSTLSKIDSVILGLLQSQQTLFDEIVED